MFNSHTAQKRLAIELKAQSLQEKQESILKHYHSEVQPELLNHYQKRLKSFILKMTNKPIIINEENLLPKIPEAPHFTFTNSEDWKSIFPLRQRLQKKSHEKLMNKRKILDKFDSLRCNPQHEFRSRQKRKQIHAPMRYNHSQLFSSQQKFSIKKLKAYSSYKKKQQTSDNLGPTSNSRKTSISYNSIFKHQDIDEAEFVYRGKTDNIEVEARQYEKMREPDQKKIHFKKIATMALYPHSSQEKKQLQDILRKSGFCKVKRNLSEYIETDNFTKLFEKTNK